MQRLALSCVVLGGCLSNPTVEVDKEAIEVARGTASEVLVSIDGEPIENLDGVYWDVQDPELATVTPSADGRHLRIGGNREGETTVRVSSYGQIIDIPTRIGPPAIVVIWTEPANVQSYVGQRIEVRARALDTIAHVQDITFDSRWTLRDSSIAKLDQDGMMLHATAEGSTTLHVTNGISSAVVPITIYK